MVNHYRKVVQRAAEYKIMIDAHEPIKDTGISRTYPNMMTREGVRGMEYNAWSPGNPPEHTTILPFTRMLAGPLDYTPGIFDLTFDQYKRDHRVYTTLAKQLALYVVLYSPLQMVADLHENYEGHPALEFIREVPVNWDRSIVLNGAIGDYVTIARQNGDHWYIGSITDENQRRLEVPFGFLDRDKKYLCRSFIDGRDAHWKTQPLDIKIGRMLVDYTDTLTFDLAAGGGQAMILQPATDEDLNGKEN
jgi:alpha-glucosidase